jgi:hypothetical protein
MDPWNKYKVRAAGGFYPSNDNSLQSFSQISHTSHVDQALNIVLDGVIRPGLVFDKSHLNTSRILVGWLSPNHWAKGYRYGNIKFDFDFQSLIPGKNYYWVEAIEEYSPHACRILITDQNRDALLNRYDPTLRDGPWFYDTASNKHYFNGRFCLEFMFEDSLKIDSLSGFGLVDHHQDYCSAHRLAPHLCDQKGAIAALGGAKFFMKAAAREVDLKPISKFFLDSNGKYKTDTLLAIEKISRQLKIKGSFGGPIDVNNPGSKALARAILNAVVNKNVDEANYLADFFDSDDSLLVNVAHIIHASLNIGPIEDVLAQIC